MIYTKRIEDGYITGAFAGMPDTGEEITKEEYDELVSLLMAVPEKEGCVYRLGTDKKWTELEDTFEIMLDAQDDTDAMLIDMEYRLTLLELGVTE